MVALLLWLDAIGSGVVAILFASYGEFFPAILMATMTFVIALLIKTIGEEH